MARGIVAVPFTDEETGRLYGAGKRIEAPLSELTRLEESGFVRIEDGSDAPAPTVAPQAPEPQGAAGERKPIREMTRAELVEVARERGIDVPQRANKARILALLGEEGE